MTFAAVFDIGDFGVAIDVLVVIIVVFVTVIDHFTFYAPKWFRVGSWDLDKEAKKAFYYQINI